MENKIVKLRKCAKYINEHVNVHIKDLNWGGCGWFAYFFGKELKRRKIPFDIINLEHYIWQLGKSEEGKESLQDYYNNRGSFPVGLACSHHLIRVGTLHIDGEAHGDLHNILDNMDIREEDYPVSDTTYTLQDMNVMLQDRWGWNDRYNTMQNRRLQAIIKRVFQQHFD